MPFRDYLKFEVSLLNFAILLLKSVVDVFVENAFSSCVDSQQDEARVVVPKKLLRTPLIYRR